MEANGEIALNGGWQFVESFQPGFEILLHWLVNDAIVESSISSDFNDLVTQVSVVALERSAVSE